MGEGQAHLRAQLLDVLDDLRPTGAPLLLLRGREQIIPPVRAKAHLGLELRGSLRGEARGAVGGTREAGRGRRAARSEERACSFSAAVCCGPVAAARAALASASASALAAAAAAALAAALASSSAACRLPATAAAGPWLPDPGGCWERVQRPAGISKWPSANRSSRLTAPGGVSGTRPRCFFGADVFGLYSADRVLAAAHGRARARMA